jgi:hypothetical protein
MARHTIKVARSTGFFVSNNTIGTDALNAISAILGTAELEIMKEFDDEVELSYLWTSSEKFWQIEEHLAKYGLRRIDW